MNKKRRRYGSWYYNDGNEVEKWSGETTTSFMFCEQCYKKHGNALMSREIMWFDDEPIDELVKWDCPIYLDDLDEEDPFHCDHCSAPIKERESNRMEGFGFFKTQK